VTRHVLCHSFASIANDLGFTEVTIVALVGQAKGSVTSKYIQRSIRRSSWLRTRPRGTSEVFWKGVEFKQTAYALDSDSRRRRLPVSCEKRLASKLPGTKERSTSQRRRCKVRIISFHRSPRFRRN
jgi:hypothetical protein